MDLHRENSRSGTSNSGQAREWARFALKSKVSDCQLLNGGKTTNGNIDVCLGEGSWILDVRVERSGGGYNLREKDFNHGLQLTHGHPNELTSEQSMSSLVFCPRTWSLAMAALKTSVAWAWLSIYN